MGAWFVDWSYVILYIHLALKRMVYGNSVGSVGGLEVNYMGTWFVDWLSCHSLSSSCIETYLLLNIFCISSALTLINLIAILW